MRNRRTGTVYLAAALLAAGSLGIYLWDKSPTCPDIADKSATCSTEWQITLLKDGQPIRGSRHEAVPTDLAAAYPELATNNSFSLRIEPAVPPVALAGRPIAAPDRTLVEFLLLLPPATLLVCLLRQVVGLTCFGTFAPALLGLAFRESASAIGVFVVLSIVFAGWWLRRGLNELHLLQVPRTALLLSCVVALLLVLVAALSGQQPRAITLFPLVILTGMVERFWAMEEEDGPGSSLATLGWTLLIAAAVWFMARIPGLTRLLMAHPELLGLAMAGQLLLGRYTGLRLTELYRFRELAEPSPAETPRGYSLLGQARMVVRLPREARR